MVYTNLLLTLPGRQCILASFVNGWYEALKLSRRKRPFDQIADLLVDICLHEE